MILELMRNRRSVRRFKSEPLPEETLLKLVEAAVTAPSAGNQQPWRFLIVKDKPSISAAARAVDKARHRIHGLLRPDFQTDFASYSANFSIFKHAPALIVPIYRAFVGLSGAVCEGTEEEDRIFLTGLESRTALVSSSMAVQNILLMAHALGIGSCCMTGPLIAESDLNKCLNIPEGWRITALIAVGYPDENPDNPGRKPLGSFVRWVQAKQSIKNEEPYESRSARNRRESHPGFGRQPGP